MLLTRLTNPISAMANRRRSGEWRIFGLGEATSSPTSSRASTLGSSQLGPSVSFSGNEQIEGDCAGNDELRRPERIVALDQLFGELTRLSERSPRGRVVWG